MFFIGIFGIETKEKEVREIPNVVCRACGKMTSYKLLKTYNFFHIFFIPLFKWGEAYYLVSRCCKSTFEISKDYGMELEKGNDSILSNLELNIEEDKANCHGELICYSCGKSVQGNYEYCPHCGAKLKKL